MPRIQTGECSARTAFTRPTAPAGGVKPAVRTARTRCILTAGHTGQHAAIHPATGRLHRFEVTR